MCQGVTKSGSPTPSEMTSFMPWTMSKKSRMPERGNGADIAGDESGSGRNPQKLPGSRRTLRAAGGSGGGLVALAPQERFGFAQHGRAGHGHADDVFVGGMSYMTSSISFSSRLRKARAPVPFLHRLRGQFAQGVRA